MSAQEDLEKAAERPDDVLAAVLADHGQIKALFTLVLDAVGTDARRSAFGALTAKIIAHETAEQELVHPLAKHADGGGAVVDDHRAQEKRGEELLSRLERMDLDSADFIEELERLRSEVVRHAESEEQRELPLIEESIDAAELVRLRPIFRAAEDIAPTHPHPHSPTSPIGNAVVGPFAAIADRARDAIAQAREVS